MNDAEILPLPNLSINGFRGIKELNIPKLEKVTLLTGKNGVGKTTILEAIGLWATRGSSQPIIDLLSDRGEITIDSDGKIEQRVSTFVFNLFWGRNPDKDDQFTVGPCGKNDNYKLRVRLESKNINIIRIVAADQRNSPKRTSYNDTVALERSFAGNKATTLWTPEPIQTESADQNKRIPEGLPCFFLGPNALERKVLVAFRDRVALTEDEDLAIDMINTALDIKISNIATVGEGNGVRLFARIEGIKGRVPLGSLGDGVTRIFGIALALACSKNGLLLIDDIGNGIHYTIQEELWRMICRAAHDYNVQVIATTHSYDCILGFTSAALKNEKVDGLAVRIEDVYGGLGAVTMDEFDLSVIAENGLEIR